jgi:methionyl-tRNA formyltransferase
MTQTPRAAKRPAVFLGSKRLGLSTLRALHESSVSLDWRVIHPDDCADPRSIRDEFEAYARDVGMAFDVASGPQAANTLIERSGAEIGFVCGWYWLFDAATIDLFGRGLWGMHNSLLPRYRGGAPLVWSIINGDPVVGTSVFRISPGMDDGPILFQVGVPNGPNETIASLLEAIEHGVLRALPAYWARLISGAANGTPQDASAATYCGQRSEEDGAIDWRLPAPRLHDFIRAQSPPYPCAFATLGDRRLRISRTRPCPDVYFGTPGQVLRRTKATVFVACGEATAIEILEVLTDQGAVPATDAIDSIKARLR